MTATTINTEAIFKALDAHALEEDKARGRLVAARVVLVAAFKAAGVRTYEAAQPLVVAWASKTTGCPVVVGKGKAKGRDVLENGTRHYEAARKAYQRAMAAFAPPVKAKPPVHKKEPVSVSRAQKAAIKAMLAEFGGDTKAAIAAIKELTA